MHRVARYERIRAVAKAIDHVAATAYRDFDKVAVFDIMEFDKAIRNYVKTLQKVMDEREEGA